MSAEILNYGGNSTAALQVTTGLYPTTATPLDIRERVRNRSVLTSNQAVYCKLYPGLRIYVEDSQETVTVLGMVSGADGSKWNHWIFDTIIESFKDAIDDCRNVSHQGRYDLVEPGVYTTQNLLNYLFLRCNDNILVTHLLTIEYQYLDGNMAAPTYVAQVPEGDTYSVSSPVLSGYVASMDIVTGTMLYQDVTVTVTYQAVDYTLTYKKLDSDPAPYAQYTLPYSTVVTVPQTPTRDHYSFVRWKYTPSLMSGSRMPASDVNALAVWNYVYDRFLVTTKVTPTGGGTVTGGGEYDEGSDITITATPSSGYRFVNWTDESTGATLGTSSPLTIENLSSDMVVIATFETIQVSVSVSTSTTPSNVGDGGYVSGTGIYNVGSTVNLSAVVNNGFRFDGYYLESNPNVLVSSSRLYSFIASQNSSLIAKFTKMYSVSISVDPASSGIASGAGTYSYGSNVTLSATPDSNHIFSNWVVNGSNNSSNPLNLTITEDITAVAKFIDIPTRKVFAWASNQQITQEDLNSIDLSQHVGTGTSIEVMDTERNLSYYYNVPQSMDSSTSAVWVVAAIPNYFTHGQTGQRPGKFFFTESIGDVEGMNDLYSSIVNYDDTTYLVVETVRQSVATSSMPVLFGNVDTNNSWIAEVEKSKPISE